MTKRRETTDLGFTEFTSVHFRGERIIVSDNIALPGRKPVTLSKELEQLPDTGLHLQRVKQKYPDAIYSF